MDNLIALPLPRLSESNSRTDSLRLNALARLYKRRTLLENLIQTLEDYQETASARSADLIDFISVRKCS